MSVNATVFLEFFKNFQLKHLSENQFKELKMLFVDSMKVDNEKIAKECKEIGDIYKWILSIINFYQVFKIGKENPELLQQSVIKIKQAKD